MAPSSVAPGRDVVFDGFRMDVAGQRLWRGPRAIRLRPKSWDVLRYLVERPGLLVTKEAIHREIWRDTAVSDDTLTQSIGELRRALGDSTRSPRFIETVHGRGFRFVAHAQLVEDQPDAFRVPGADTRVPRTGSPRLEAIAFVGREPELSRLHECLRRARQGARQLVFVTGEAGIGKTALSEEFLRSPALGGSDVHLLHGQCIQQHGQREPYMPVLEAFERLLTSPIGVPLRPLFRRVAPCWYAQMPALLSDGPSDAFHTVPINTPPERMLREGATFLEALAAHSTVVLVLEDLHWSDAATADLLSCIAQRPDPARLLIIGMYRPAEASAHEHPIRTVKQTLRVRRRCTELALDYLSLANVREYLGTRFGDEMPALARLIYDRTDGTPLFAVAIIEDLIRRGRLAPTASGWTLSVPEDRLDLAVPDDLLDMMVSQFQSLGAAERSMLEAGSVVGARFDPQTLARALGADAEDIEAQAQHMAHSRLFVKVAGRTEDSDAARSYEFVHALHRHMLYEQIPDRRRQRLHRTIGETLESIYGERTPEIAAALSIHFEQGGELMRAVKYLSLCVARARERFAPREALKFSAHALGLLERLPETSPRHKQELELRLLLGVPLSVTRGYTSPEVRENYERARTLCEKVGDARQLFEIVHAAWYRQLGGAETDGARRSAEELARISESLGGVEFRWRARLARGRTELWNGRFGVAVPILLQCIDEFKQQPVEIDGEAYGVDPVLAGFMQCGLGLWFLGRPDQARAHAGSGLAHAEKRGRPFELASGLCQAARIELLCGSTKTAAGQAARAAAVCADNDVAYFLPGSRFLGGAALIEQGDIDGGLPLMLQSLAEQREASGPFLSDFMLASIAVAYGRMGRWDDALRRVHEGIELTETMLERIYVAELWRVKGELLHGKARASTSGKRPAAIRMADAADACVRRALDIAREQEARSLELRSAMSLTRFAVGRGGNDEALELLRSVYASFSEGFDTKDLQDAKALLNALPR
jgi:DNA-binding winged helix-turn-helix (wHTH) protein/tetratricopeptide (TPR) repeat protein